MTFPKINEISDLKFNDDGAVTAMIKLPRIMTEDYNFSISTGTKLVPRFRGEIRTFSEVLYESGMTERVISESNKE